MNINDRLRYKHAYVNPSSSGSNAVVAAVPSMKIKVIGAYVVAAATNTVKFMSASTDISAQTALAVNGGFTLPITERGTPWFETVAGEALNINLSASTQVGVTIVYYLEK